MSDVAVIGGGAAGLAAAIAAARAGVSVVVYEQNDRIGKKLLATGNGRCNITNMNAEYSAYNAPEFVMPTLAAHSPTETRTWFEQLGLLTREEREGRVYPLSNTANSVVDVLRTTCERLGVRIVTQTRITSLDDVEEGVTIVACGGGSTLLETAGHTIVPARPVLCPLACEPVPAGLSGVRARARISVMPQGDESASPAFSDIGEVLFRDYGVSGIVVFDASRYAQPGDTLVIQLMPERSRHDIHTLLHRRYVQFARDADIDVGKRELSCTYEQFMVGIFHPRINAWLIKSAGLKPSAFVHEDDVERLENALFAQRLRVLGPGDEQQAQVMRGGAMLDEFDDVTLQSRLVPHLYAAGEALNVDGRCGGYNLQWAWASGRVAGESAVTAAEALGRHGQMPYARGAARRLTPI